MNIFPLYLAGEFVATPNKIEIINPFTEAAFAFVCFASRAEIEASISSAVEIRKQYGLWTSLQISNVLHKISQGIEQNFERFVETIILESAKPRRYAKIEVQRAIETFRMAANESTRLPKELISLDDAESGSGLMGRIEYTSAGVIGGISPFNFPLNLIAHKVAPAIATKSPIILKPASKTPLTALLLAEIIHECGLPRGAFSVLPCSREIGDMLIEDSRIQVLSFTGSADVGWAIKKRSGKKKVVLELGGNAAALVHHDADLELALRQCLVGAFAYSGQVCIHTQRIYVHEQVFDEFLKKLSERTENLKNEDPLQTSCEISVMIDEANALRVENWVQEAVSQGAKLCCGGQRTGSYVAPTILTKIARGMKVIDEEVFGPVVCVDSYSNLEEAIAKVNDSKFGLQASIFTSSHAVIETCYEGLQVGGLVVNRATTFRTDQMPYGGIKDSGMGREGVRYAMLDYLEPKLLVF